MIGTSCCQEFPYPELSLCRSQKYSHGPRSSEIATRTNETRGFSMVPYGGAQDWHGRTWSVSGKCHSRNFIEPRNQRAAKKLRLCKAQRSSKNSKNSAQNFLNNENKPQKGQGKSSKPQSIQEIIFLFVDEVFFEGLQLSFFLPPQQTPPYRHRKVIPHRNIWFSSCLSAEYCLGVPEVDPNKKPRKNFFVKNDHAQYGKEFCQV